LPIVAGDAFDVVEFGEPCVDEGVIGFVDVEEGAIALEEVGEEADGFLIHIASEFAEFGEEGFALFVEGVEVVDVEPLAGELGGESSGFGIGEESTSLGGEDFGLMEGAIIGGSTEFRVGGGGPEEVTEAAGKFPIVDGSGNGAGLDVFESIEEAR